jgi:cell wall-associated NlpC family hydrolase
MMKQLVKIISTLAMCTTLQSIWAQQQHNASNNNDTAAYTENIVRFAETLKGTKYKWAGCTNPAEGFDCSGFITYVYTRFKIKVPRSSKDFTNYGKTIELAKAKRGDLILFTGTDSTMKIVGHMGIITNTQKQPIEFIHSSSGKNKGVIVSSLANYYKSRFVKIIRVRDN